jgi:hypothetical protein
LKEKSRERNVQGFFSQGRLAQLAMPFWNFPDGRAIKGCFKGKSLNFMCTLCVGRNYFD